jgi:hypothetical protein
MQRSSCSLTCEYLEWAGTEFGMQEDDILISAYQGARKITELAVYPLAYHPDWIGVQERCTDRAREWEAYCGYSSMHYEGPAFQKYKRRYTVDSRVIIDTDAYNTFNSNNSIAVLPLKDDKNYTEP